MNIMDIDAEMTALKRDIKNLHNNLKIWCERLENLEEEKKKAIQNRQYIAGVVDFRGCLSYYTQKQHRKTHSYLKFLITSSEEENLNYLHKLTNMGIVTGHHSSRFQWLIAKQKPLLAFLKYILPEIRLKKKEIEEAIHFLSQKP